MLSLSGMVEGSVQEEDTLWQCSVYAARTKDGHSIVLGVAARVE